MNADPAAKLKSHGDFLERHFADRIREVIPSYARIWAEYVGNDGAENALPMPEADEVARESRTKNWERLYTIFESLALCWDIEDELRTFQEIKNFKVYAHTLNLWMAFYSHLGRIHDMMKAIAGELKKPKLLKPFDEYWDERHIVLHGPKVPMKWVYKAIAVPPLGELPHHWNDKMMWSELQPHDIELIAEEVSKILHELEERLERCLAELRKRLPAEYGWRPISWDTVVKKGTKPSLEGRGISGWPRER